MLTRLYLYRLVVQHVYGKEAVKRGVNEWDARACVEGDYSWAEQQPDNDLGKSITPGFRNAIAEGRAFGVPTVRSDIEPYAQRSVADTQNYGDDPSARQDSLPHSLKNQVAHAEPTSSVPALRLLF